MRRRYAFAALGLIPLACLAPGADVVRSFDGTSGAGGSAGGQGGSKTTSVGGHAGADGASGARDQGGPGGEGGENSAGSSGGAGSSGSNVGGEATEAGATGAGGAAGVGGTGGEGGDDDPGECVYNGNANLGTAGAATSQGLTVKTSPTLGPHLAGSDGRPLYIYGNDIAGNCNRAPQSGCLADCAISWPRFFDAGAQLSPSLNPDAFGSILDEEQQPLTTYYGWPLHVYKSDTYDAATTVWTTTGQGKGKTFHLARPVPYNLLLRKEASTLVTYIVARDGMTLYTFAKDTVGGTPVSACTGACLAAFPPYVQSSLIPVGSLLAADLSLFARPDNGKLQVAFKGAPLYKAAADSRPGDWLGLNTADWIVAKP